MISRRSFVCGVSAGGAALLSGLAGAGCGNAVSAAPGIESAVDDDPKSPRYGQLAVSPALHPDLQAIGGAVTVYLAPLAPAQRPFLVPTDGILLIHRNPPGDAPEYLAVQSSCPHAGCPLGYSESDALIECPCHSSRFRAAADPTDPTTSIGEVVHLPARANLASWDTSVSDGVVYIDLKARRSGSSLPAAVGGKITLPLAAFPVLAKIGGAITGQSPGLADVLLIARVDAATVIALSAVCTHLGCSVNYQPGAGILCPCHGSSFALSGAVTGGPAPSPLKKYSAALTVEAVEIGV